MARADVQLVSLASRPFLSHTTPSKIPSLLASQIPIIAHLEGDGAALVRDSGAGIVVPPGSPDMLAQAMCDLADAGDETRSAMGLAGRRYYERNLSAQGVAIRIIDALACASASA